ncbi:hypothetical protein BaRGS_00021050, partial [Batillaria attramentaria]
MATRSGKPRKTLQTPSASRPLIRAFILTVTFPPVPACTPRLQDKKGMFSGLQEDEKGSLGGAGE